MLTKEDKANLIKDYRINEKDTGSSEVQIALITKRINSLTGHFTANAKDHHSRRGLLKLVGQRRRLLNYLSKNSLEKYRLLTQKLGLRK